MSVLRWFEIYYSIVLYSVWVYTLFCRYQRVKQRTEIEYDISGLTKIIWSRSLTHGMIVQILIPQRYVWKRFPGPLLVYNYVFSGHLYYTRILNTECCAHKTTWVPMLYTVCPQSLESINASLRCHNNGLKSTCDGQSRSQGRGTKETLFGDSDIFFLWIVYCILWPMLQYVCVFIFS